MRVGFAWPWRMTVAVWVDVGSWQLSAMFHPMTWHWLMPTLVNRDGSSTSVATFGPVTLNTRRIWCP